MWRIKTYLKFILAAAIALAINFCIYTEALNARDYTIRKSLADNGIAISSYEIKRGILVLEIPSADSEAEYTDIMLIRQTLNTLREIQLDYNDYYIKLVSPSGKVFYSDMFEDIYSKNEVYAIAPAAKTISDEMYRYRLKYDFADTGIEMLLYNLYDTVGMEDKALYLEVRCEKSTLSDTIDNTINEIKSLNQNGATVYRYSVVFRDKNDTALCVISCDTFYNDTLYWKSPTCAGIMTSFD